MKQTILLYTENYARGGGNRYFTDIVNVIPLYYDIIVSSNPNGLFDIDFERINRPYSYISVDTLHIHTYPIKGKYLITRKMKYMYLLLRLIIDKIYNKIIFYQLLSKYKPKVVISANGGYPAALTCLQLIEVSEKKYIKNILTVVSMPRPLQKGAYNFFIKYLYSSTLKKINYLIVNSQSIKKAFINLYKKSPDNIFVIYNCIENYTDNREQRTENRKLLTIGYAGRIEESKGIFILIDAFYKLLNDIYNVKLLLVGDGNIQKVNEKLHNYGIESYVTLTGFYRGKIEDMLSEMDIFVFPSFWEGFPYSVLEAMNSGKIIVSTNIGGIPEAIEDGVNGLLIPPSDSNLLYETLKKITQNIDNYRPYGKKAKETVENKFSPEIFHKMFLMLLEKVTAKKLLGS